MERKEKAIINITKVLLFGIEYNLLTTLFNGREGILVEIKKSGLDKPISYFLEGDMNIIINLTGYDILEYLSISGEKKLLNEIIELGSFEFDGEEFNLELEKHIETYFSFGGKDYKIIKESKEEE